MPERTASSAHVNCATYASNAVRAQRACEKRQRQLRIGRLIGTEAQKRHGARQQRRRDGLLGVHRRIGAGKQQHPVFWTGGRDRTVQILGH